MGFIRFQCKTDRPETNTQPNQNRHEIIDLTGGDCIPPRPPLLPSSSQTPRAANYEGLRPSNSPWNTENTEIPNPFRNRTDRPKATLLHMYGRLWIIQPSSTITLCSSVFERTKDSQNLKSEKFKALFALIDFRLTNQFISMTPSIISMCQSRHTSLFLILEGWEN